MPVTCRGFDGCVKGADTPHTPELTDSLLLPACPLRVAPIQRHDAGELTPGTAFAQLLSGFEDIRFVAKEAF